jgi:hypothetical protein
MGNLMALFDPPFVIPSDPIGVGVWLNSHNLEHAQLVRAAQTAFPSASIQVYDLGTLPGGFAGVSEDAATDWINNHQSMTESISVLYGINLPDLTEVDPQDEDSWRQWEIDNANWHVQARAAAGLS